MQHNSHILHFHQTFVSQNCLKQQARRRVPQLRVVNRRRSKVELTMTWIFANPRHESSNRAPFPSNVIQSAAILSYTIITTIKTHVIQILRVVFRWFPSFWTPSLRMIESSTSNAWKRWKISQTFGFVGVFDGIMWMGWMLKKRYVKCDDLGWNELMDLNLNHFEFGIS